MISWKGTSFSLIHCLQSTESLPLISSMYQYQWVSMSQRSNFSSVKYALTIINTRTVIIFGGGKLHSAIKWKVIQITYSIQYECYLYFSFSISELVKIAISKDSISKKCIHSNLCLTFTKTYFLHLLHPWKFPSQALLTLY